jgi:very-short-patch-repair endonuclease
MLSNLPTEGSSRPCARGRGVDTVPMPLDEMRAEMGSAPKAKQRLSTSAMRAQSGTETMVRVRLRARRLKARVQVTISGLGRVDLVVGDRLIIEVDSEECHRTKEQYAEDRRRDRHAAELGYITLRFTYAAVTADWGAAEEQVLTIVRDGRRLWPASGSRKPRHLPRRHEDHR